MTTTPPLDRTLYVRHMALRRMRASLGRTTAGRRRSSSTAPTPGWSATSPSRRSPRSPRRCCATVWPPILPASRRRSTGEAYNRLALLTGTKVIHIAERDTQISNVPKETDEFVNTWSVEGFYEEGVAPAELGWGTHERRLPPNAFVHSGEGPCNQICIARPGMETWVRSWVPAGEIRGMVIRHGEAFTMCEHLTVNDADGRAVYRPTVHYAYHPSDAAINSVLELRMRGWQMQERAADPQRRDRQRARRARRAADGPPVQGVVDRVAAVDRRGPRRGAEPERHHACRWPARSSPRCRGCCDNPDQGLHVPDDLPWRDILARRRRVPRHDALRPERLGPGEQPARPVRRRSPTRPARSIRPTPGSSPTSSSADDGGRAG